VPRFLALSILARFLYALSRCNSGGLLPAGAIQAARGRED